jgi:putative transposase
MVARAEDWPWSSARSHVAGRRARGDPLTDCAALNAHVPNWRAMLRHGAELGDAGDEAEALTEAIEARLRTGRPLAAKEWVAQQEAALGRPLAPQKRGPKPKPAN